MPRKASKDDFEKIFNKLFGTNIKWTKLSRDELIELATVLNHPEIFLARLGVEKEELQSRVLGDRLWQAGKEVVSAFIDSWQGPFAKYARSILMEEKAEEEEATETSVDVAK